jgi:hypothetical protein
MDPFRALVLRLVRSIITSTPSAEALHKLLGIVVPDLTEDDIVGNDLAKRKKAFKEL